MNPVFTTSKRMYVHKTNRTLKDLISQSKGFKRIKNSRLSNRRRRANRGSNHNMYPEKDEKALKDAETEPESNLNLELKSYTYVIKNFDLDDSKSN